MRLDAASLPQPLTKFVGLAVDVAASDGQEYSISLTMRGARIGDSHKYLFRPSHSGVVRMPFADFEAEARGRPAPDPQPVLLLDRVETLIIQIRSGFGQQQGPYSLTLNSITGIQDSSLLGGEVGWQASQWASDTDAVRGGVSTASLAESSAVRQAADFTGNLDPSILGAAFAGMRLDVASLPQPLTKFVGLAVDIAASDGQEYSISLTMRGARIGDSHKYLFRASQSGVVRMPFADFEAEARGRPAPDPQPVLLLDRVETLIIQIRSGFGQQQGPYSLTLNSITGMKDSSLLGGEVGWQASQWAS